MNDIRLKIDAEPTDAYEKAKLDLLKAMKSINSLPSEKQRMLAEEVFGVEKVKVVMSILGSIGNEMRI